MKTTIYHWRGFVFLLSLLLAGAVLAAPPPPRPLVPEGESLADLGLSGPDALVDAISKGHSSYVRSVAFGQGPDGRMLLASGSRDNTVRLWDPATGKLIRSLTGHSEPVYSVAFGQGPDGRMLLASGSRNNTVRLWDPATGRPQGAMIGGQGTWIGCQGKDARSWRCLRHDDGRLLRRPDEGGHLRSIPPPRPALPGRLAVVDKAVRPHPPNSIGEPIGGDHGGCWGFRWNIHDSIRNSIRNSGGCGPGALIHPTGTGWGGDAGDIHGA